MWNESEKESYLLLNVYYVRVIFFSLCWGFTAKSTQWGHVERGQFT